MNPLFLILYMMELFISLNSCSTFDSCTSLISEFWMIVQLVWGWRTPVLNPVFVSTEAVIANYWKGLKSILLYMLTLRTPFNILSSLSLHHCSFDSVIQNQEESKHNNSMDLHFFSRTPYPFAVSLLIHKGVLRWWFLLHWINCVFPQSLSFRNNPFHPNFIPLESLVEEEILNSLPPNTCLSIHTSQSAIGIVDSLSFLLWSTLNRSWNECRTYWIARTQQSNYQDSVITLFTS